MCGGTVFAIIGVVTKAGLSPRVRGNRAHAPHDQDVRGSIPACAGEPPQAMQVNGVGAVYPRVCGGTVINGATLFANIGLSPRVRGNLLPFLVSVPVVRSIPACAGEPLAKQGLLPHAWVYPRVCGGTVMVPLLLSPGIGLSPRVRGNRSRGAASGRALGSIPACAGEPPTSQTAAKPSRVYPRVCGGTAA